jgi:NADPH2:quinone reductase
MKAIVVREFGGPEVMKLGELPDPTPGPQQVLVRIGAAGINPVETYIRAGAYARLPQLPFVPGTDFAGTIEAVGSEVRTFKKGDRVYGHGVTRGQGAYAERAAWDVGLVQPLPERVSFQQGAAIGVPYGTAWRALFVRGNARAGETVLVHGASGGTGTATVQIAHAHGLTVIGTAGTDEGLELVRGQGAHHALNHRHANYLDQVMPLTDGRGVDVIVEMLANVNLDRDLEVLALRGRVVVVGNRGRIEIDPRKTMGKDSAILGMTLFNASPEELAGIHKGIGAGLETGALTPVVGREFPLADAPKAHMAVMEPGAHGKIVLIP